MNKRFPSWSPLVQPGERAVSVAAATLVRQDADGPAASAGPRAALDPKRYPLPQEVRLSVLTPPLKAVADAVAAAYLFIVIAFNALLWYGVHLHPERQDIARLAYYSTAICIFLWCVLDPPLYWLLRLRVSIAVTKDSIVVTWFGIYRRKFPHGPLRLVDVEDELDPAGWHRPERVRIVMAVGDKDVTLLTVHGARRGADLLMRLCDLDARPNLSSHVQERSA